MQKVTNKKKPPTKPTKRDESELWYTLWKPYNDTALQIKFVKLYNNIEKMLIICIVLNNKSRIQNILCVYYYNYVKAII